MKLKNKILIATIVLDLVFIVVFNLCFFLIAGTIHTESTWVAYAFIHVSYLSLILIPLLKTKTMGSHIYQMTYYVVGGIYFIASFVANIVFLCLELIDIVPSITTNVVLFGLYLILFITFYIFNEKSAEQERIDHKEARVVKNYAGRIARLIEVVEDRDVKRKLQNIHDEIHSLPSMETLGTKTYDSKIDASIDELMLAVSEQNNDEIVKLCKKIHLLLVERDAYRKEEY